MSAGRRVACCQGAHRWPPVIVLAMTLALGATATGCGGEDPDPSPGGTTASTGPAVLDPDRLPVLVATRAIAAGTEGTAAAEQGWLEVTTVTRAQFPEDAVVSVALVEGLVATQDIVEGTIVTAGMFIPARPAP